MKYSTKNPPLACFMRQSTWYKGAGTVIVRGVCWHCTGANNPNLKRYVQPDDNAADKNQMLEILGKNTNGNDWNHIYREAGVHGWIGKTANGTVLTIQAGEWNKKAWGVGAGSKGSCNNGWIQFEICEDALTDKAYFDAVYKEACELTAYLCALYHLDPMGYTTYAGVKVPIILCHQDTYQLGLGGNHSDVYNWFNKYGKKMEDVRRDVKAIMESGELPVAVTPKVPYTVRVKSSDGLNCRSTYSTSGERIKTYANYTTLIILEEKNGWGYTGEGWVSLAYTEFLENIEEEDVLDMTTAELTKLIDERITAKNVPYPDVKDIPEYWRPLIQEFLDLDILNGGTPRDVNPTDVNLTQDTIKALVIMKQYIDLVLKNYQKK